MLERYYNKAVKLTLFCLLLAVMGGSALASDWVRLPSGQYVLDFYFANLSQTIYNNTYISGGGAGNVLSVVGSSAGTNWTAPTNQSGFNISCGNSNCNSSVVGNRLEINTTDMDTGGSPDLSALTANDTTLFGNVSDLRSINNTWNATSTTDELYDDSGVVANMTDSLLNWTLAWANISYVLDWIDLQPNVATNFSYLFGNVSVNLGRIDSLNATVQGLSENSTNSSYSLNATYSAGVNCEDITGTADNVCTDDDTADTSASTECAGDTTYLSGEGNCNDLDAVYWDECADAYACGWWDEGADVPANEISESSIDFDTVCTAAQKLYVDGDNLACADDITGEGDWEGSIAGNITNISINLGRIDSLNATVIDAVNNLSQVNVTLSDRIDGISENSTNSSYAFNASGVPCGGISGAVSNLCTLTASGEEADPLWTSNLSNYSQLNASIITYISQQFALRPNTATNDTLAFDALGAITTNQTSYADAFGAITTNQTAHDGALGAITTNQTSHIENLTYIWNNLTIFTNNGTGWCIGNC